MIFGNIFDKEEKNEKKTGNSLMNRKDLLDIQKLSEYCGQNKDFAEKF